MRQKRSTTGSIHYPIPQQNYKLLPCSKHSRTYNVTCNLFCDYSFRNMEEQILIFFTFLWQRSNEWAVAKYDLKYQIKYICWMKIWKSRIPLSYDMWWSSLFTLQLEMRASTQNWEQKELNFLPQFTLKYKIWNVHNDLLFEEKKKNWSINFSNEIFSNKNPNTYIKHKINTKCLITSTSIQTDMVTMEQN